MAKECVVGLDIGTTKVCAIVGEVDDNGAVEIVGIGNAPSKGIRKGVVIDIDAAAEAIMQAVSEAKASTDYDIHSVVVGVTGEHIASLNSKGVIAVTHASREITAEDVDKALDQARIIVLPPDREIIHAIPRTYIVDGQAGVRYPVGMAGTRLEVETHIVTGAVTLLQNVAKAVQHARLSIETSVLEPIASAEAVVTVAERSLGVALVDIGGGTTDIAVFAEGDIVFSSVVPIGGTHVTRDISIGLRCSIEEADRVKLAYGAALPSFAGSDTIDTFSITGLDGETYDMARRSLLEIINPRIEEIFDHVRQEIEKSGYHNFLTAGIVLTGGGSLMPAASTFCTEVTGLPTRVGNVRDLIGLKTEWTSPVYATGLGLVLYGARYTRGTYARKLAGPAHIVIASRIGKFVQQMQKFFARVMGEGGDS